MQLLRYRNCITRNLIRFTIGERKEEDIKFTGDDPEDFMKPGTFYNKSKVQLCPAIRGPGTVYNVE